VGWQGRSCSPRAETAAETTGAPGLQLLSRWGPCWQELDGSPLSGAVLAWAQPGRLSQPKPLANELGTSEPHRPAGAPTMPAADGSDSFVANPLTAMSRDTAATDRESTRLHRSQQSADAAQAEKEAGLRRMRGCSAWSDGMVMAVTMTIVACAILGLVLALAKSNGDGFSPPARKGELYHGDTGTGD
jgi:hypothetical protein